MVLLLPASTDTGWFHEFVLPNANIEFRRGRIRFLGWDGVPMGSPKAGSIIAVSTRPERRLAGQGRSARDDGGRDCGHSLRVGRVRGERGRAHTREGGVEKDDLLDDLTAFMDEVEYRR